MGGFQDGGRDVKKGDRIRLIEMVDDPMPIEPGATGTVKLVQDAIWGDGKIQVTVEWDEEVGRSLSLIVPPDRVEVIEISESESPGE